VPPVKRSADVIPTPTVLGTVGSYLDEDPSAEEITVGHYRSRLHRLGPHVRPAHRARGPQEEPDVTTMEREVPFALT